jgi:hypothetical protein
MLSEDQSSVESLATPFANVPIWHDHNLYLVFSCFISKMPPITPDRNAQKAKQRNEKIIIQETLQNER